MLSISDVKTRKRRNVVGIDMIRNNRIKYARHVSGITFIRYAQVETQESQIIQMLNLSMSCYQCASPRFLCRPTAFCSTCWNVGRQSALHKENSELAAAILIRHISTFRGYRILFSIRNPYINHFTNQFSIHS